MPDKPRSFSEYRASQRKLNALDRWLATQEAGIEDAIREAFAAGGAPFAVYNWLKSEYQMPVGQSSFYREAHRWQTSA